MVDVLKTGASTLLSMQRALATTGHNIANVTTEGYSRQNVEFASNGGQNTGFGFLGKGAGITGIERSYDSFVTEQVRNLKSSTGRYGVLANLAARLEDSLGGPDHGLHISLRDFSNAWQDVAANPSSLPERQVLLDTSRHLVERQRQITAAMQDIDREINSRLKSTLSEINDLTASIARLNNQITAAGGDNFPNDLLDRRDLALKKLAEFTGVTTAMQEDGAVNVYLGKGQPLVIGGGTRQLSTARNPHTPDRLEVALETSGGAGIVTRFLQGGELQGMMDFRNNVLQPAQSKLGLLTVGLREEVNAQHEMGFDLNGQAGGPWFTSGDVILSAGAGNAGSAQPDVSIDNWRELKPQNYLLTYDGGQWQLTRLDDETTVTGQGPFTLDGIAVDPGAGEPVAGDSFLINPVSGALQTFSQAVASPAKIAAAGEDFATGGPGDNRNAVKISQLMEQGLFDGGRDTFTDFHSRLVTDVAQSVRNAKSGLEVESTLLGEAESHRESISGVSLDEEAANMLRYQQLYQAAAQLIKVSETTFQTLLGAV